MKDNTQLIFDNIPLIKDINDPLIHSLNEVCSFANYHPMDIIELCETINQSLHIAYISSGLAN